jgi:hypothetical protein
LDKFFIKRVGLVKIIRRVLFLTYELKLPSAIKIYSIILITYLEPVFYGDNFFNRLKNDYFSPVEKTDFNNE